MNTVIFRTWTEHERGWGNRPDGFSLHVSEKDMQDYINNYWDSMPETVQGEYYAPDETFVKVITKLLNNMSDEDKRIMGL